MAIVDSVLMRAKFRGSLLGSLLGDCLGGPFEGDYYSTGMRLTVKKYFDKLDGPYFNVPLKGYSDDTAMTTSVAKCLIDKPAVDYSCMAHYFVQEYFKEPKRGYGENVVEVFHKLRQNKFTDIFKPAQEQFMGRGSFGNGGAMRVAPLALFFNDNHDQLVDSVTKASELTHTHRLGINGAILQAFAIQQSFQLDPSNALDVTKFTSDLIEKMHEIEKVTDGIHEDDPIPYQTQLKHMQELLDCTDSQNPVSEEEVLGCLGNSVAALHSVPTAIYCFLKAHSGFPEVDTDNVFRRAIQYAVTLGGDTDTIAAMAGAIVGAYFGEGIINPNLIKHCEYHKETMELADKLYEAFSKRSAAQKAVN